MITAMTGLSYSIIILMIEMGNCPNLAIPMILAVLITKFLTENFGKPLAHQELRELQVPYLIQKAPESSEKLNARDVMKTDLVTLPSIADM